MRIALLAGPYDTKRYRAAESLGLKYLASTLESCGQMVDVFEMELQGLSEDDLIRRLKGGQYSLIGFGALFTTSLPEVISLAERIRLEVPSAHFVVGGQGTTFVWKEILQSSDVFDSCVCFEGEHTIVELIASLEHGVEHLKEVKGIYYRGKSGIHFTGFRQPITNLDGLPFPKRDLQSRVRDQPHFMVLGSRGCQHRCQFCASGFFGNRYYDGPRRRVRSVANLVEEIASVVEQFGATAISFVDDDFLGCGNDAERRVNDFCDLLARSRFKVKWAIKCRTDGVDEVLFRKMHSIGLERVFLGIDAGNEQDLKRFAKQTSLEAAVRAVAILRALGIGFQAGLIMFNPTTTLQQIEQNLAFLESCELGGYDVLMNRLKLYRGSPLLHYYNELGLVQRLQFGFEWQFQDARVDVLRKVAHDVLLPFRLLETELYETRFRVQGGIIGSREQSDDCDQKLRYLDSLERDISCGERTLMGRALEEMMRKADIELAGDSVATCTAQLQSEQQGLYEMFKRGLHGVNDT